MSIPSSRAASLTFSNPSGVVNSFLLVIDLLFKNFFTCVLLHKAYTTKELSTFSALPIITGTLGSIIIEGRLAKCNSQYVAPMPVIVLSSITLLPIS